MPGEAKQRFVRLFGSAIVMQAVLSLTNLLVGLTMIRRTSDLQYGSFVLISNALLLLTALQSAFIQPELVRRITGVGRQVQSDLIGGLYRDQRRIWPVATALAALTIVVLYASHRITPQETAITLAGTAALMTALYREFFRMVLLARRRPEDVLRADIVYAVLLLALVYLATFTGTQAAWAALALSVAALIGGHRCARSLWRAEPWNNRGAPGILLAIAPLGIWSAGGAAIHWAFSQGYNYIAAGILNVAAVAALASTRLLIMPINLMSTGIGTVMLPTVTHWMAERGPKVAFRRQAMFAIGLAALAVVYFGATWAMRDWIFDRVLKRRPPHRDELLLLWYAISLLMLLRDQLLYTLLAKGRLRQLAGLTLACALTALSISYFGMRRFGVAGALVGVLIGEIFNVSGQLVLSLRELRMDTVEAADRSNPPSTTEW